MQSLVDEGKISDAEAAIHPHRSLLLKVLNGQPANDPDLAIVPVQAGDRLMFCSDGVCGLIDDDEIEAALRMPDLDAALDQLVSEALAEGGIDNITAIVADVVEDGGTDDAAGARRRRRAEIPDRQRRIGTAEPATTTRHPDHRSPVVVEDDEARYSPRAPNKRRMMRPLVGLLVLLLIAGAGLAAAYAWTRTQYYVGAAGDKVAIYQGLSDGLPGVQLSRVFEVQPLAIADLPPYYQEQVRANIDVPTLESARETIMELTAAAERCAEQRERPRLRSPQPAVHRSRANSHRYADPEAHHQPHADRDDQSYADGFRDPQRHPQRAGGAGLLRMPPSSAVTVIPRKRRGVELVLIIFALLITISAYAQVDYNVTGELSVNFPYVAGICTVLALAAHFAVRWRLPYADPVILPCVIVLNGLGLTMIHRIDLINDPPLNGARQQLIWTALGVILFIAVVVFLRDHKPLRRFTYTIGLSGIVLLLLPLVPGLGTEKFGARIWIEVAGYSFQPAEAAKVLLSIAFAGYLVEKREVLALAGYRVLGLDLPRARDLGPIGVIWALSLAILVLQRDLGTSLLFFGLFVMMLYVATERPGWAVLGTLLFAGGSVLRLSHLQPCPGPGRRLAGPVRRLRRLLPGDQRAVRDGVGRAARHRARAGPSGTDPAGPQRLHRGGDR